MDHVYIIFCQRGQSSPEIYSILDSYEKAIVCYYNYHIDDEKGYKYKKSDNSTSWFMFLYKIPINENFIDGTKLQKSSPFRIKFKTWGDLRKEYLIINRDDQISQLGI